MDINVDQGIPRNDMVRFDDGKYLYKFPNGNLDIDRFTRDFDQYKEKRKEIMNNSIQDKIEKLNNPNPNPKIPPYELPLGTIIVNMKKSVLNIFDDLINFNFNWNTLTRDDNLFYLGLFLIIVGILICLIIFLINGNNSNEINEPKKIYEVRVLGNNPLK